VVEDATRFDVVMSGSDGKREKSGAHVPFVFTTWAALQAQHQKTHAPSYLVFRDAGFEEAFSFIAISDAGVTKAT
jgi:hypothetical protein